MCVTTCESWRVIASVSSLVKTRERIGADFGQSDQLVTKGGEKKKKKKKKIFFHNDDNKNKKICVQ